MNDPFRLRAGAACLVLAPTGLLAAHLVQVTPRSHDTATEIATIAAHQGRYQVASLIAFVALLLHVPALLTMARPLWAARPRLALVGTSMSFAGLLALVSLMGSGPVTLAMADGERASMVALTDRYESGLLLGVWAGLMVLGWSLGPIVLGVGLWRCGMPGAMPILLVAGLVLQMADAGRWPLAAGFACTAAALAVVAIRLLPPTVGSDREPAPVPA